MANPELKARLAAAKAAKRAEAKAQREAVLEQAKILAETLTAGVRQSYDKEAKQLQDTIVKLAQAVLELRQITGTKMSAGQQKDLWARHFAAIEAKLEAKTKADYSAAIKLTNEVSKQLGRAVSQITKLQRPSLQDGKVKITAPVEIKGLMEGLNKIVSKVPKEISGEVKLAYRKESPEKYINVRLTTGKRFIELSELQPGAGGTPGPSGGAASAGKSAGPTGTWGYEFETLTSGSLTAAGRLTALRVFAVGDTDGEFNINGGDTIKVRGNVGFDLSRAILEEAALDDPEINHVSGELDVFIAVMS